VHESRAALDMSKKLKPKALAFASAFDKTWNIGNRESGFSSLNYS
jgi:hypothetical protein